MTYAFVGQASNSTASNVTTLSVTYSPTEGNGLLVLYSYQASSPITMSSIQTQASVSMPFTEIAAGIADGSSFNSLRAFWVPNVPSGVTAIKVNTGTAKGIGIQVLEYSGLTTVNAVSGSNSLQATATTATDNISVAVTPTGQPAMVFAVSQNNTRNAAPTAGTGFTSRASAALTLAFSSLTIRGEDKRVTATTATNALFTNASITGDSFQTITGVILEAIPAATLTTPTSNRTGNSVVLGFTTDTASGTGYGVMSTSSLSGITTTQIKAGQNASSVATSNANGAISATGAVTIPSIASLSPGTYNYALVQNAGGLDSNIVTGSVVVPTVPIITSTTGTPANATPANGSSLTVTGTTFLSPKSTGSISLGGATQTTTSWADTSIALTVDRSTNKYGTAVNLSVTNSAGNSSANYALTSIQPQSGWAFIDIGTPNTTATNRITSSADLASGDQVAYDTKSGLVTVSSDGTFVASSSVASFNFEVWTTGSGWGSQGLQTLIAQCPPCIVIC